MADVNGLLYLVELSHEMDDFPVAMFDDAGEAERFARNVDWQPSKQLMAVTGREAYTPVCINIIELRHGVPIQSTVVREFDQERADTERRNRMRINKNKGGQPC